MSEEKKTSFWRTIPGNVTIMVAAITAVIIGFGQVKDAWEEHIGDLPFRTVETAKDSLDFLEKDVFLEQVRRDSIERYLAELLALEYMNESDSVRLVIQKLLGDEGTLYKRIDRLETMIETNQADEGDPELVRIWEFLKKTQKQDSLYSIIKQDLDIIKKQNEQKLNSLKSKDKIE